MSNVNRWRGQLRLPKITLVQLANTRSSLPTQDGAATLVDLEGQLSAAGMSGPMSGAPTGSGSMSGGARGPFAPPIAPGADAVHWVPGGEAARSVDASLRRAGTHARRHRHAAGRRLVFQVDRPQRSGEPARGGIRFADRVAQLVGDGPPQWKLPEGWRQAPPSGMRYATLKIPASGVEPGRDVAGQADGPLEVSVVKLLFGGGDELEYVRKNVNIWRDQLQAPRLTREDLGGADSARGGRRRRGDRRGYQRRSRRRGPAIRAA